MYMSEFSEMEHRLHEVDVDDLEQEMVRLAVGGVGGADGGLFMWSDEQSALLINFHVVKGVRVALPEVMLRQRSDGRPNGIALEVWETQRSYLCRDTHHDPHYAPYFIEVGSMVAVPIPYQSRAIGVLTVSHSEVDAFDQSNLVWLQSFAQMAARYLRRAQLYRASQESRSKPFLIKGMSPGWLEVEQRLENVSPTNAPVLIHGESGTGKDLVANAIHFNSPRAKSPLITVNCAAIPETMLESILFGHVKGAFTGATFTKIGEFEKADGGTLFLDEVGELPLTLQAKVLRAVEGGEIQPLGSNDMPKIVDVRLLCATNRNLVQMVLDKGFRDDLYYRISVMTLELPALRSYKNNLSILARVFIQEASHRHELPRPRLHDESLQRLIDYDFPGNVRELKNAMEHAVIMSQGHEILPEHLPRAMTSAPALSAAVQKASVGWLSLKEQRERWLDPLEKDYLRRLLDAHNGQVPLAAKRVDVNTVTLYRLMKKRGITLHRKVKT
jgi:anaerobic nitric oxide reductase transcription regulator